ncbi:cation transporter [Maribacter chungangensis]|uniref:Cation transporter n=1 Tax=Maribacter chungangensis TaxID=1069117 RepID=A0ABW3B464_9FLAO
MECNECKKRILRNLSRILDVRVLNINIENGLLYFLYAGEPAFEKVKQELRRLGYPITSCLGPKPDVSQYISGSISSEKAHV